MKVLISGGSGFIGSHLCEIFLENGADVWCIDNFLTSSDENLNNCLNKKNFVLIKKDICDINPEKFKNNFTHILHFASPASPVDYNKYPVETLRVNSKGTENMIKIAFYNLSILVLLFHIFYIYTFLLHKYSLKKQLSVFSLYVFHSPECQVNLLYLLY